MIFSVLGITITNRGITFANLGMTFADLGMTFIDLGMTFANMGITFVNLGITFAEKDITFADMGIIFVEKGITFADLDMTFALKTARKFFSDKPSLFCFVIGVKKDESDTNQYKKILEKAQIERNLVLLATERTKFFIGGQIIKYLSALLSAIALAIFLLFLQTHCRMPSANEIRSRRQWFQWSSAFLLSKEVFFLLLQRAFR